MRANSTHSDNQLITNDIELLRDASTNPATRQFASSAYWLGRLDTLVSIKTKDFRLDGHAMTGHHQNYRKIKM